MNGPSISKKSQEARDQIERETAKFLANGGTIQREDMRPTKRVDLTLRNYAPAAIEEEE